MRTHVITNNIISDTCAGMSKEQPEEEKEAVTGGKGSISYKNDIVPSVICLSDIGLDHLSPL